MPKGSLKRKRSIVDDGLQICKRRTYEKATLDNSRLDQQINPDSNMQSTEPLQPLVTIGDMNDHNSHWATTQPLQFMIYNRQCIAVRRHVTPPSLSSGLSRALILWRPNYEDTESRKSSVRYPKPVCARPRPIARTSANGRVMTWLGVDYEEVQELVSRKTPSHMSEAFSVMSILPSFELTLLEGCLMSIRDLVSSKAETMDHDMLTDIDIGTRVADIIFDIADTEQDCKQGQKYMKISGADMGTLEQNEKFRCLNSITIILIMLIMAAKTDFAGAARTMALHLCEVAPDLPTSFLCWMGRLLDNAEEQEVEESIDRVCKYVLNHLVVHLSRNSPALIWFASKFLDKVNHESESLSLDHWLTHDEDSPMMLWMRILDVVSFEPRHQHHKRLLCSKFLASYEDTSPGGLFLQMQALIESAEAEFKLENYDAAAEVARAALEHWSDDLENLLPLRNYCQTLLRSIEEARFEHSPSSLRVEDD